MTNLNKPWLSLSDRNSNKKNGISKKIHTRKYLLLSNICYEPIYFFVIIILCNSKMSCVILNCIMNNKDDK